MKNLATCKPTEFLTQTNKIRHVAEKWLEETDILNIRKRKPVFPDGATPEEKVKLYSEQLKKNARDMLDALLDKYPEDTLALLALLCFVEPENVDDHTVEEYLNTLTELLNNQTVVRFFGSLAQLGQIGTSN